MLWLNPDKPHVDKEKVTLYEIAIGSVLDVPKIAIIEIKNFSQAFKKYIDKQVDDIELLKALIKIYKIYRDEGAVNICSLQYKSIKSRHESFVIELIKDNLVHLKQLDNYIK